MGSKENLSRGNRNSTNKRFKMCSSPHTIRVIILQIMKRARPVLGLGKKRKHTEFWWGNLKEIF